MRTVRWCLGTVVLGGILAWILIWPFAFPLREDFPFAGFVIRSVYVLILTAALCVYRVARGPTAADRVVAVDILGVLVVGYCAVISIATNTSWYIDIGIAWALQSFIGALGLSKYLEGKPLDE